MKPSVLVVGSGAGGSVAAWALATAGHPVRILEKGRNLFHGLGDPNGIGPSPFGNDEVKEGRFFEDPDPLIEPRTSRTQLDAARGIDRSFIGDVNGLPTTVGGGTVHWDAKVPRFWRQDFKGLSLYGPVPGANVADWPLTYDDLAPFYDEIEARLGVQGDVHRMPAQTLAQAPRAHQFPMPPNPPMLAGLRLAEGAKRLGYHAYPFPMAVNSRTFDGRPACNSCGFCSGFGCPINARGGAAVSFLHHALIAGAELVTRAHVDRVEMRGDGTRALGVSWIDSHRQRHHERADIIVLAPSAIETARLLLLSGIGNRSGQLGRNLMFHYFTVAGAMFTDDLHAWRGPSTTFTIDDFVGPVSVKGSRLPYLKGGICEVGGSIAPGPLAEAQLYASLPGATGPRLKELMQLSPLRRRVAGLSMVGEDMPQVGNRVDLDPAITDVHGIPVPRITRSSHPFEIEASTYFAPLLTAVCLAAPNAVGALPVPIATAAVLTGQDASQFAGPASTAHIMGTARMGHDPRTSVVDPMGRLHDVENVYVADGSVFVSSGGFNPTNTIMALSLRMARGLS